MPTISSIKPSSRDPMRYLVKVGREVVARIRVDSVERLGLSVGMVWEEPLVSRVLEAGRVDAAINEAMKVVRRRMIGSGELVERLKRKGHDETAARAATQQLLDKRVLDDERYGRAVVDAELARKPAGPRLLQQKLYRKRLPRPLIDRVVHEAQSKTDMVAEARRLAERKLRNPGIQRCDAVTRHRRVWGLLARRGFDMDTIREAMRDLPEDR